MSSTSMALAGKNITIGKSLSTPGTLNTWLQNNNGYVYTLAVGCMIHRNRLEMQ
jgi:hypothetical protein